MVKHLNQGHLELGNIGSLPNLSSIPLNRVADETE